MVVMASIVPNFKHNAVKKLLLLYFQILLVMIVVRYESPTYGDYSYPLLANVFGFTYALVPLLPVIICAVITVFQSEGNTVIEVCIVY